MSSKVPPDRFRSDAPTGLPRYGDLWLGGWLSCSWGVWRPVQRVPDGLLIRDVHVLDVETGEVHRHRSVFDGPGAPHPEVSWILETPDEVRQAADSLARLGVDFVTVYSMLSREVFDAVVERAEARGLPVAGRRHHAFLATRPPCITNTSGTRPRGS